MELKELCQAAVDGKQIQFKERVLEDCWVDVPISEALTSHINGHKQWEFRTKPELEPVDLSVLIESGIDCEFSDYRATKTIPIIRKLARIRKGAGDEAPYVDQAVIRWNYCKPRMNHIHAWQGGECPLPDGVEVKVTFREGTHRRGRATTDFNWSYSTGGSDGEIIAFEVLGLMPGHCWPWQVEK